jgi:hypothetical protein
MNFEYAQLIEQVSSKDINEAAELLIGRKPTLVVTGNAVNIVPSVADIQKQLK